MLDKETAIRRLTNRWNQQVERFPPMRRDIPLQRYIASNLAHVMENDLLASYEQEAR